MTKKILITTALSLFVASVAFGQGYRHNYQGRHSGRGYGDMNGRGMHNSYGMRDGYNNYTEADYAKIDAISQKYYPEMEKIRVAIYNKNSEIRLEMNQATPNQSKVDSLIDQESKLRADRDKLRVKMDNEIRKTLGK